MAMWRERTIYAAYASCVALPLVCSASVIGALALYSRKKTASIPTSCALLMELATDLAYGISTLRTRAEHARPRCSWVFVQLRSADASAQPPVAA